MLWPRSSEKVAGEPGAGSNKTLGAGSPGPDWQLASLVCKTLWNFSENITNAASCFGDEAANTLLALLSSFLGKTPDCESVNLIKMRQIVSCDLCR